MEENIIEFIIDDNCLIQRISIVSDPATGLTFMTFNNENLKDMEFKTINEERKEIMGVVLRPNQKIKRKDDNGDIFYGFFSEDTIRKAALIFHKNGFVNKTDIEHQRKDIDGLTFFESWIVEDPNMDKSKAVGLETIKGDWVATCKIENDELWDEYIKTGKLEGFSIDSILKLKTPKSEEFKNDDEIIDEIKEVLKDDSLNSDKMYEKLVKMLENPI